MPKKDKSYPANQNFLLPHFPDHFEIQISDKVPQGKLIKVNSHRVWKFNLKKLCKIGVCVL